MRRGSGAVLALILLSCLPMPVLSQSDYTTSPDWRAEKCRRYSNVWQRVKQSEAARGLSAGFVTAHEAFIASGCTAPADVCPRSAAELEIANQLVLMAMSEGMASTFLPFACKKAP